MSYKENPKTKGSGIICAIPQEGICPKNCPDCFFQSGRSYLEPLIENLPNLPSAEEAFGRVVRVNDGNDSNVDRQLVLGCTYGYEDKFFNTAIAKDLEGFPGPVVLTINPGELTDQDFFQLEHTPNNLMFVRFRANTWNVDILDDAILWYTSRRVPIVITFMAYFTEDIPQQHKEYYVWQKRTLNSYWAPTKRAWDFILHNHRGAPYVYTCGRDAKTHGCIHCGVCIREYYNTKERLRNNEDR